MLKNLLTKLQAVREEKAAEDGGFTLIELLVVVVIIGILIAIAIPLYLNYEKGSHDSGAQSDVRSAVAAVQQCYTDNDNTLPDSATSADGFLSLTCTDANGNVQTETSPVTSGDTVTYTLAQGGGSYTIAGSADNGSGATYTYDSTTGQITSGS